MNAKPRVGISCSEHTHEVYFDDEHISRLEEVATVLFEPFNVQHARWGDVPIAPEQQERLAAFASDLDILIVSHGSARVTADTLRRAPRLKMVGDIEGDRLAQRIDVQAAKDSGVVVVDTSHASSWPVSEWVVALALLGLRQQAHVHDMIGGRVVSMAAYQVNPPARELTGKEVGLIGFGRIAWRLCELLRPFRTPVVAFDPHAPRELGDALDIDFAPLERVMRADVVVCLAPGVPSTRHMIGERELDLLRPDSVFINVSRGSVVDTAALVRRAERGDSWFGLDVLDEEPIPANTPLRALPNVFLSPHVGGVTVEAKSRFFSLMVDEVCRFLGGQQPRSTFTERVLAGRDLGR